MSDDGIRYIATAVAVCAFFLMLAACCYFESRNKRKGDSDD